VLRLRLPGFVAAGEFARMLEGCGKDREILVGTGATIRDYPYGMPILDHDPDFGWLVMPLVTRSLRRHCPRVRFGRGPTPP
jgi:hypothetical protein